MVKKRCTFKNQEEILLNLKEILKTWRTLKNVYDATKFKKSCIIKLCYQKIALLNLKFVVFA